MSEREREVGEREREMGVRERERERYQHNGFHSDVSMENADETYRMLTFRFGDPVLNRSDPGLDHPYPSSHPGALAPAWHDCCRAWVLRELATPV